MKLIKLILVIALAVITGSIGFAQNVGIGNTNPLMKLHVSKTDSAVALFENTQALNPNVSTALYFKTGSGIYPYTGAVKTIGQSSTTARLGFFTYASLSANGLLERMSITDDGKIGMGIASPQTDLHINPNGAGSLLIGTNRTSGGYTNIEMGISTQSNGYGYVQATKASGSTWGDIILNPSGGNVGVGTTTPKATMDINGGIALPIKVVTSDYVVQNGDYTIVVDMQSSLAYNVNIYLPNFSTNKGRIIKIVVINSPNVGSGMNGGGSSNGRVYIYDASGTIEYNALYFTYKMETYPAGSGSTGMLTNQFWKNDFSATYQCIGVAPGWYLTDQSGSKDTYIDTY